MRELLRDTFALVLAGGNGTRLGELTKWQCKPAIPFAGHFRNIDFTLSNCVNSGVRRIAVLTQYKAHGLIAHLNGGWNFLPRATGEFVEVWPAQQRIHAGWYAGTADAVFQNLDLVLAQRSRYTLVLAGDHIYKMDYRRMLEQHVATGAGATIGCVPVPAEMASSFGVLGVNAQRSVHSFIEKPSPGTLESADGSIGASTVLASMGIYVFTTDYLIDLLNRDASVGGSSHDFGKDVLPTAVREGRAGGYQFVDDSGTPGYWRDVGTLDSYWGAHMELLEPSPAMDLYDEAWPIHTMASVSAPARISDDAGRHTVANSLLASGTVVGRSTVSQSVLSTNARVGDGSLLDEVVVLPGARIGSGCKLRRCIVDSNVHVADGTVVGFQSPSNIERVGAPRIALITSDATRPKDFRSVA
ncbi:MAG: glucose-1-phosphate adenylyltransferase [Gammaproteobacteria bacterium]